VRTESITSDYFLRVPHLIINLCTFKWLNNLLDLKNVTTNYYINVVKITLTYVRSIDNVSRNYPPHCTGCFKVQRQNVPKHNRILVCFSKKNTTKILGHESESCSLLTNKTFNYISFQEFLTLQQTMIFLFLSFSPLTTPKGRLRFSALSIS
jgi:hypothetical protein